MCGKRKLDRASPISPCFLSADALKDGFGWQISVSLTYGSPSAFEPEKSLHWHFLTERGMIFNYSRILMSMSRQKLCWRQTPDTRDLLRYTPILFCQKSVPRTLRCPNKNAKITARFLRNVSLLNTLSVLSKGFVSSLNAIATVGIVSRFAFPWLLVSAILTALPNFARGLMCT